MSVANRTEFACTDKKYATGYDLWHFLVYGYIIFPIKSANRQ